MLTLMSYSLLVKPINTKTNWFSIIIKSNKKNSSFVINALKVIVELNYFASNIISQFVTISQVKTIWCTSANLIIVSNVVKLYLQIPILFLLIRLIYKNASLFVWISDVKNILFPSKIKLIIMRIILLLLFKNLIVFTKLQIHRILFKLLKIANSKETHAFLNLWK